MSTAEAAGTRYDAIVVGVGGMGSAAVYHLAKRGQKVLGLEQFGMSHDKGSSHGESRIIRLTYQEQTDYPLLIRAHELWLTLQKEYGQEVFCVTGSLDISSDDLPPEDRTAFRNALHAAKLHNLQHEELTALQVNQRFPGFNLPPDFKALYQPQGGLLASERCIQAHVAVAEQHGAEVHLGESVQSWHAGPQGDVVVVTDKGEYRCGRLVMTAGAWNPKLVPPLQACTSVQRNFIGWFDIANPEHFNKERFPVYNLQTDHGVFYGFPHYELPGMKIGKYYHLRQDVDNPSQLDREITEADEQVLRATVEQFFPTAGGRMTKAAACMFTNTPDTRFIIDFHPGHPQVILCSACSGHGFKFCSVIGEILADLAVDGSTRHTIGPHKINASRPAQQEFLRRCQDNET